MGCPAAGQRGKWSLGCPAQAPAEPMITRGVKVPHPARIPANPIAGWRSGGELDLSPWQQAPRPRHSRRCRPCNLWRGAPVMVCLGWSEPLPRAQTTLGAGLAC